MADKKISALTPAATPLAGTEVLPIVQSGATVKVSVDNLTAGKAVSASSLTAANLKTSPATANLDISGTTIAAAGSDANVDVNINAKGTGVAYLNQRWGVNASGALVASAGNTYDIGNGTNNPRDVNIDRYAVMNALTASKTVFTDPSKNLTSTGTVGTDQGGTGLTSFTLNGVLYASSTSALTTSSNLTYDGSLLYVYTGADSVNVLSGLRMQNNGENGTAIDFYNAFGPLGQIAVAKKGNDSQADEGLMKFRVATNSTLADAASLTETGNFTAVGSLTATSGNITATNGNFVVGTSGKGIDFSATASGSGTMTSELLSDYEEGTFTPTLEGNTGSSGNDYAAQTGTYIKVGSLVTCVITVGITTWGTNTGTATLLKGLPFTTASAGFPITTVGWDALNANYSNIQGYADPSATQLVLIGLDAGAASSFAFVPPTSIKNGSYLYLTFTYRSA